MFSCINFIQRLTNFTCYVKNRHSYQLVLDFQTMQGIMDIIDGAAETRDLFFFNEQAQDCALFLLVKKEFTSKRSQRSKYRSVRKNSYTQYLRRCSSTTKHHLQLHLTFRASTQYPRGPRNERWQPAGGSPGTRKWRCRRGRTPGSRSGGWPKPMGEGEATATKQRRPPAASAMPCLPCMLRSRGRPGSSRPQTTQWPLDVLLAPASTCFTVKCVYRVT